MEQTLLFCNTMQSAYDILFADLLVPIDTHRLELCHSLNSNVTENLLNDTMTSLRHASCETFAQWTTLAWMAWFGHMHEIKPQGLDI